MRWQLLPGKENPAQLLGNILAKTANEFQESDDKDNDDVQESSSLQSTMIAEKAPAQSLPI